jgi:hypothetical protein
MLIANFDGHVRFDFFELAPTNEAVMSSKGRLRRYFPSSSVRVYKELAEDPIFLDELAKTIAQLSHQPVPGQQPKVKKSGSWHDEDRDTTHPGMVTEFLEGVIASVGQYVPSNAITKNTREEVSWADAKDPWRRSPIWLLLKISLQLTLEELMETPLDGQRVYKSFMVSAMSSILSMVRKSSIPADVLYTMNAKIARRLVKLPNIDSSLLQDIRRSTAEAYSEIQKRWRVQQDSDIHKFNLEELRELDFSRDGVLYLPEIPEYISALKIHRRAEEEVGCHPTNGLIAYMSGKLPESIGDLDPTTNVLSRLNAFEDWIEDSLPTWTESHHTETDCVALARLLESYQQVAAREYKGNPEAVSTMVLVSIEMWISCDQIATTICPLLRDYDTGIPMEPLQNLLLPSVYQMKRLSRVEEYLMSRKNQSITDHEDYKAIGDPLSFPVKYFDSSLEHQILLRDILARAEETKRAKLAKWRKLKERYDHLMSLHNRTAACTYVEHVVDWRYGTTVRQHSSYCEKCSYKDQAQALSIDVHEWPLPSDLLAAKAVVFESSAPEWFVYLRDIRSFLQQHVLTARYKHIQKPRSNHHLDNDPHLKMTGRRIGNRRISLLSEIKPHVGTHRRGKSLATASESDICVQNGLVYRYFDTHVACFVDRLSWSEDLMHACTYRLPGKAKSLQKFMFRPATCSNGPPPNTVIAEQSNCPDHMTLQEFKELSDMPLGTSLQWWKIAAQLKAPMIDLNRPEALFVILQCIYQVGTCPPSGEASRPSHEMVQNVEYCWVLLDALKEALGRITVNWASVTTLRALIAIARRLLSLSSDSNICASCLEFLVDARLLAFDWIRVLRENSRELSGLEKALEDYDNRILEVAITCVSTFDLDQPYQIAVLASSDASMLIQCSIIVKQRWPDTARHITPASRFLYERYLRLLQKACQHLSQNQRALESAVQATCKIYRDGAPWRLAQGTRNWVTSEFTQPESEKRSAASLNLLTGELLINGLPLDHLPEEYRKNARFTQLFGKAIIEVVPSLAPGMAFDSKNQYNGYSLQFNLQTKGNPRTRHLVVLAFNVEEHHTLLPQQLFESCLPSFFVTNFIHWYNNKTNTVEFRPKSKPWERGSRESWILTQCSEDSKWQLTKSRDQRVLVGSKSRTATLLSQILSPLAKPLQIHLILSPDQQTLNVELDGLNLGFSLQRCTPYLRSREHAQMFIDQDQRLGTLIGFKNKLIMRDATNMHRMAILAEGRITITQWQIDHEKITTSSQVQASVDLSTTRYLHIFQLQPYLCSLVGNGSLESELFLAHLHAITSYCLQDPFTQKTGTERALQIIGSARTASFLRLSQRSLDTLRLIGKLTPQRVYYPTNLRDMQSVKWHANLSSLSQHPRFHTAVTSIFTQAERQQILLRDEDFAIPDLNEVQACLHERDRIRSSTFRVSGYGAEEFTTAYDTTYYGRVLSKPSDRCLSVFTACSMIINSCGKTPWKVTSDCIWHLLQRNVSDGAAGFTMELSEMKYQARFIGEAEDIVASNWLRSYQILTQQQDPPNKYAVMFWLSALACSKIDRGILVIFALAFTDPRSRMRIPNTEVHRIEDGTDPRARIPVLIQSHTKSFHTSPESRQEIGPNESRKAFGLRVHRDFQTRKDRAVKQLHSGLSSQWPCAVPSTPKDTEAVRISDYVNKSAVIASIREIFDSCFANLKCYEFLQRLEEFARSIGVQRLAYPTKPTSNITSFESAASFISVENLFDRPAPDVAPLYRTHSTYGQSSTTGDFTQLRNFLNDLQETLDESEYHKNYLQTLEGSFDALERDFDDGHPAIPDARVLDAVLNLYDEHLNSTQKKLFAALSYETDNAASNLAVSQSLGQGPRVGPELLLQQLSRKKWNRLPIQWKRCVIAYGVALTAVRQLHRIISLHSAGKEIEAAQDWYNVAHRNWNPYDNPDTLLLEVESDITIRERQEQVASEMRMPGVEHNASMQLNMGEGKSSVIAPIVAASLADGTRLVRIIVAKPQSKQMTQMLISKLGGLLDRRLFFLPISRSLQMDESVAHQIDQICRECMEGGGVLLVQPEHLLSFQLMVLDQHIAGKTAVAALLSRTQQFFDENSRDIVDESDENFNVRFELIYTMGSQQPVEAGPDRWTHIGEILGYAREFTAQVMESLPFSIMRQDAPPGAFPYTRILRMDAAKLLEELIAKKICRTGFRGFPLARQPPQVRDAVYTYITKWDLAPEEVDLVESSIEFFTDSIKPILYLLRGLIAGGVLIFVLFRKRWSVNYGLDLQRSPQTRLAVPYRAKDQPSLRSDFSHPDVVILLTHLSYYYGGLTDDDLFLTFQNLIDSDQKDIEYQDWIRDVEDLPKAFRHLEGINVEDRARMIDEVFPHLRKVKSVVDFFLNTVVFPKNLRVFPEKLSASGWDIGKAKRHATTAFSGTCDTHLLLPLATKYLDLPHQRHTNALVLHHLLQPINQVLILPSVSVTNKTDVEILLDAVMNATPQPRVIIDVGALVLDLSNEQLARVWLEKHTTESAEAAIFFDDYDELTTIDRAGNVEKLQTSPFGDRLRDCIVFLDEAHTRGTDLKLPMDYRAAVTLGPYLTKDRLVQGR